MTRARYHPGCSSEVSRFLAEALASGREFTAEFALPRDRDAGLRQDGSRVIQIRIGSKA